LTDERPGEPAVAVPPARRPARAFVRLSYGIQREEREHMSELVDRLTELQDRVSELRDFL
jgi:hypothetical protein